MDLNILIAALSLLVASLAEGRSILRDKSKDKQIAGVIYLLSIVQALDKIIDIGNQLLLTLSEIPISTNEDKTRFATLRKKKEILKLVKQQTENLDSFSKIYNSTVLEINSKTKITLKDTIEFMVPDKTERIGDIKGDYLHVLSWKIFEDEPTFSQIRLAAISGLRSYTNSIIINDSLTELTVSFPTKFRYTDKSEVHSQMLYNLKSPKDLRALLSKANEHLNSVKDYRIQLANLIQTTFTLADLLESK